MTKQVKHIVKIPVPNANRDVNEWSSDLFRAQVEDALRVLDADRIDLVQWCQRDGFDRKNPAEGIPRFRAFKDDLMATAAALRDEGKIGYVGVFCYNLEFAREYVRSGAVSFLIPYFNIWDTSFVPILDELRARDMGLIALCPLRRGLLVQSRADLDSLPPAELQVRTLQAARKLGGPWITYGGMQIETHPELKTVATACAEISG